MDKKLLAIQQALSVPKNQRNNFGNYNYRSCEDILEAVKPLLKKNDCVLTISDTIEQIGDRVYVKATAILRHGEEGIQATAYARESEDKKGMDSAQITGAASSYARKYALNGLFAIDDTKDADSHDNTTEASTKSESSFDTPSAKQIGLLRKLAKEKGFDDDQIQVKIDSLKTKKQASDSIQKLTEMDMPDETQ